MGLEHSALAAQKNETNPDLFAAACNQLGMNVRELVERMLTEGKECPQIAEFFQAVLADYFDITSVEGAEFIGGCGITQLGQLMLGVSSILLSVTKEENSEFLLENATLAYNAIGGACEVRPADGVPAPKPPVLALPASVPSKALAAALIEGKPPERFKPYLAVSNPE